LVGTPAPGPRLAQASTEGRVAAGGETLESDVVSGSCFQSANLILF
jgi:hypothetical protein